MGSPSLTALSRTLLPIIPFLRRKLCCSGVRVRRPSWLLINLYSSRTKIACRLFGRLNQPNSLALLLFSILERLILILTETRKFHSFTNYVAGCLNTFPTFFENFRVLARVS